MPVKVFCISRNSNSPDLLELHLAARVCAAYLIWALICADFIKVSNKFNKMRGNARNSKNFRIQSLEKESPAPLTLTGSRES